MLKLTRNIIFFLFAITLTGCAINKPKTIGKSEVDQRYTYSFAQSHADVMQAVNKSISDLDWTKEFSSKPEKTADGVTHNYVLVTTGLSYTSSDKQAWYSILPPNNSTNINFIRLRTPMSLVSYGVHIYLSVYTLKDKTVIKMTASTNQYVEKKKIPEYLETLRKAIVSNLSNM